MKIVKEIAQNMPAIFLLMCGIGFMWSGNFDAALMAFVGMFYSSMDNKSYRALSKVADDAIAQTKRSLDLCADANKLAADNARIATQAITIADTFIAGARK